MVQMMMMMNMHKVIKYEPWKKAELILETIYHTQQQTLYKKGSAAKETSETVLGKNEAILCCAVLSEVNISNSNIWICLQNDLRVIL